MRIAVWKTGHEIADRVAQSLAEGFGYGFCNTYNTQDVYVFTDESAHIGYGILRGMSDVFRRKEAWFNVDRGYLNPGHYEGNYRISYRGTQLKWHDGIPRKPVDIKLEPIKIDYTKNVLVCPPTQAVCDFFNIDEWFWMVKNCGICSHQNPSNKKWFFTGKPFGSYGGEYIIRQKGNPHPINWDDYSAIITFNSSVGWQALQMGIPVLSDVNHSAIGSFYNCSNLQSLTDKLQNMPDNRMELFEAMAASQFTLEEIEQGKAWPILEHYLSMYSLDLMTGKPSPQMSPLIASSVAPDQTLKSIFSSTGN